MSRIHAAAQAAGAEAPFAEHFAGWRGPWNFSSPARARRGLEQAGFAEVEAWLEAVEVHPEYLRTIVLGTHLERLPEALREPFTSAVLARLPNPLAIDYVRLNLHTRRAGGPGA